MNRIYQIGSKDEDILFYDATQITEVKTSIYIVAHQQFKKEQEVVKIGVKKVIDLAQIFQLSMIHVSIVCFII